MQIVHLPSASLSLSLKLSPYIYVLLSYRMCLRVLYAVRVASNTTNCITIPSACDDEYDADDDGVDCRLFCSESIRNSVLPVFLSLFDASYSSNLFNLVFHKETDRERSATGAAAAAVLHIV